MKRSRMQGFTLVELIIVIVITGILAGMVAIFLRSPVQSYVDTAARAELSDIADLALRRLARDVRLALPNSVYVSADRKMLQFLIVKTGGRYVDVSDAPPATLLPLDFSPSASLSFDIAGAAPSGRQQILANDYIVVFNIGAAPADAYTGGNIARVASVSGTRVTLASNPFATASPSMPSPTNRFQVVTGTVTYVCAPVAGGGGTLTRNYSTSIFGPSGLGAPPYGTPALLAKKISGCAFDYTVLANTNAALVGMTLTLTAPNGENVSLSRQVHVDNTP
ncbi:prepilin-type N-terminal cleavage/methylation domain-containing protein [Pseudoduganella sp. FT93W]|uniref:Prepilin-type N-terminal cleavage/methylation domain-containing protein n=1 Tax=Duganella fentianensis TaxID=2692177 RepID=A0A845I1N4_9BURK|nr:prepilin-type N-terminal cleavage/methylation domain-containing protein [Duganella fentianensis]MYN47494.1 prepilin-type N-terminal cleavage/methylation domain-containing protein [Duganella fentianensis]